MKKALFAIIVILVSAAAYGSVISKAAPDVAEKKLTGLYELQAGRAYRFTSDGAFSGVLRYKHPDGSTGSHILNFDKYGYYIPYENQTEASVDGISTAELMKPEKVCLYNGRLYDIPDFDKNYNKPDKVFKTGDGRLGIGLHKNGELTINMDFERKYLKGLSGFVCQAPDGLYLMERTKLTAEGAEYTCEEINAKLSVVFETVGNYIKVKGSLGALVPQQPCRAETVAMHLAIGADDKDNTWIWIHSLDTATIADGQLQELQERPLAAPYFYPIAYIFPEAGAKGLVMALDPEVTNPAANISYNGTLGSMYTVFEAKDGEAVFTLDVSANGSEWGIREAFADYMQAHQQAFPAAGAVPASLPGEASQPDKAAINTNGTYKAIRGSLDRLTDSQLLYLRAMAGTRPVYVDLDMALANSPDAALRAVSFGFIPVQGKTPLGKIDDYIKLALKIAALPWQPVSMATTNNPAVSCERFGGKDDEVYYIVCKNRTASSQPAIISIDTLPMASITVKELVTNTEKTARSGNISTTFMPGDLLVFEVENRWK